MYTAYLGPIRFTVNNTDFTLDNMDFTLDNMDFTLDNMDFTLDNMIFTWENMNFTYFIFLTLPNYCLLMIHMTEILIKPCLRF